MVDPPQVDSTREVYRAEGRRLARATFPVVLLNAKDAGLRRSSWLRWCGRSDRLALIGLIGCGQSRSLLNTWLDIGVPNERSRHGGIREGDRKGRQATHVRSFTPSPAAPCRRSTRRMRHLARQRCGSRSDQVLPRSRPGPMCRFVGLVPAHEPEAAPLGSRRRPGARCRRRGWIAGAQARCGNTPTHRCKAAPAATRPASRAGSAGDGAGCVASARVTSRVSATSDPGRSHLGSAGCPPRETSALLHAGSFICHL